MDFRNKKRIGQLEASIASLEAQLAETKESYAGRSRLFSVSLEPRKIEAALKAIVPTILVDSTPMTEQVVITIHAGQTATDMERRMALRVLKQLLDMSVINHVLRDS